MRKRPREAGKLVSRDETMKPCVSWPGYFANKIGKIFSANGRWDKGLLREMTPSPSGNTYRSCSLHVNGVQKTVPIHRIVLDAWIGPKPKGMECRHLDGNPSNNNLDNLCWGTHLENQQDRIVHGTNCCGEKHAGVKLTLEKVRQIRSGYKRGVRGFTLKDFADRFGVTFQHVSDIVANKCWRGGS